MSAVRWWIPGVAVVAMVGFALVGSAAARNPRLERLALNETDHRTAADAVLRRADLARVPPGWRALTTIADSSGPICPWQDYSNYTVTGRAEADFQPTAVGNSGFIGSTVELFASADDALGKFTVDTHPGTASCEGEALRKALGTQLETASAKQLAEPKLGDHAAAFEFIYIQQHHRPTSIYVELIEFVRGRAVASLETTNFNRPGDPSARSRLAQLIDARLS